jgi:steroid delta-isomerase-like uncharacterized protein
MTANETTIKTFIEEVMNQGHLDRCDDLVLENFIEIDPLPGQSQGRQGLKDVIAMLRTAFPDIHWTIDETIAQADKVVTRFTWTGTHRAPFLGIPATAKHITVKGVVIDRLEAAKMADSRILMDTFSMLQQLGALATPR